MEHDTKLKRPLWKTLTAGFAILFGLLTLLSGGKVLFGGEAAQLAAGNTVNFVLWFNFLSGAFYILAGVGILAARAWAKPLTIALAITISAVFIAFGWHVFSGGAYEMRTVGAMILRSGFWGLMAWALSRSSRQTAHRV